ncbi:GtrA family protein [Paraburkholderia phymatum]|uniref:GtrA family protein n=1 Tax=Paraburkholderia phymatum TaxID=148447 RepID=A0ACC6TVH5_9BURK
MSISLKQKAQRWSRFIMGGLSNTAFTYLIYLGLSRFVHYQIAYFVAYCCGIVFAYWFNATFVFKVPLSWRGAVSYPIVYAVQYATSAVLLGVLVKGLHLNSTYAPLFVTACMLPLTYLMSKIVLHATRHSSKRDKVTAETVNKF